MSKKSTNSLVCGCVRSLFSVDILSTIHLVLFTFYFCMSKNCESYWENTVLKWRKKRQKYERWFIGGVEYFRARGSELNCARTVSLMRMTEVSTETADRL